MKISYVFIAVGFAGMVWASIERDWFLLFVSFTLSLNGWMYRNIQPSPWVKHPTIRDNSSDTTN
jgi:hypothetical protein